MPSHNILVDLLVREEVIYELQLRGVTVGSRISAVDARKELRKTLKMEDCKVDVENLRNVMVVDDELKVIEEKLQELENTIKEFGESVRPIDYARMENRVIHVSVRIRNVKLLSNDEETIAERCRDFHAKLKSLYEGFKDKHPMDKEAKETACRKLSEANIEEEDNDVFFESLSQNLNKELNLNSKELEMLIQRKLGTIPVKATRPTIPIYILNCQIH